jgi:hypothetical protein
MDVHKNRCMTIPGATPFGLSSPPCDDEDDPTNVAKRNRLQSVHPRPAPQIPLRNIRDFGINNIFWKEEKDRTFQERLSDFDCTWLEFLAWVFEMVRWLG